MWNFTNYSVECLCEKCYYLCYPADCPYIRSLGFNLDDFDFYPVDVQNEIRNIISKWYDKNNLK